MKPRLSKVEGPSLSLRNSNLKRPVHGFQRHRGRQTLLAGERRTGGRLLVQQFSYFGDHAMIAS